ncbi:hypothetical protein EJ04DRAFT_510874 [Polyplosphaeria fusca]|uniref:Uncharacterized protein n=1 Tax=Polyplosphaeria fusca TaxID=682080 RepID=A0A9P4V3K0_9PLEO|nr:hypothetical protein EJ04DRAFT_510874 [Polyplosphaeria fusca]
MSSPSRASTLPALLSIVKIPILEPTFCTPTFPHQLLQPFNRRLNKLRCAPASRADPQIARLGPPVLVPPPFG